MPFVGDEVAEDSEHVDATSSQNGWLNDKLVLIVIILILFHVGALVSSLFPEPQLQLIFRVRFSLNL